MALPRTESEVQDVGKVNIDCREETERVVGLLSLADGDRIVDLHMESLASGIEAMPDRDNHMKTAADMEAMVMVTVVTFATVPRRKTSLAQRTPWEAEAEAPS